MKYKDFQIVGDGTFGYKNIKTVGAGKLPNALKGMFTSYPNAKKAIDTYLNSLPKGKSNGTTKDTAGDK